MSAKHFKLLLVEDDPSNVQLIKAMLDDSNDFSYVVTKADTLASALECLRKDKFDAILLDLGLPDSTGEHTYAEVYQENPLTAIIIITSLDAGILESFIPRINICSYLIKGEFSGRLLQWTVDSTIERKKHEMKIRESEEKFRIVFENSAIAMIVANTDDCIVSWNKFTEELLGMEYDDLYLKSVSFFYSEKVWKNIKSLDAEKISARHQLETVVRKKDGSSLEIEISRSLLKDNNGLTTGSVGIIRDISARKRMDKVLIDKARKSKIFFNLIQDLTMDMASADMLEVIVTASKSLVKADTASIIILDEKDGVPRIKNSSSCNLVEVDKILNPSLDASKSITGWVIENKKSLLLHGKFENDERFVGIQWKGGIKCSINVPIIFKDVVKGTINLNITTSDKNFSAGDIESVEVLAKHIAVILENSGVYKSMKDKYIEELTNSNKALEQMNMELERAQSQLVQSEKMSAVGQLASGVAHEINNPLAGVIGNVQIIKMDLKSGRKMDDLDELLDIIEDSAKRCKSITQNLLDFSRIKKDVFEGFNIHSALDKTIVLVGYSLKNSGIEIKKDYVEDLPMAFGNVNELQQVFLNMISNAKWAIEKSGESGKGSITIGTRQVDDKFLEATFCDSGIGISAEGIKKVFDPFFTTKEVGVGTGLGLSICYKILQNHKGDLWVESKEGEGTTFHIKLPMALEPAKTA